MTNILLKYYSMSPEYLVYTNRYLFISDWLLTTLSIYEIKIEKEKRKWTRV